MKNTAKSKAQATNNFFQTIPLPACIIDNEEGIYLANQALAEIFRYGSLDILTNSLQDNNFFSEHFAPKTLADLQEKLINHEYLHSWPIIAQTLDGKEMDLKITIWASWLNTWETPQQLIALFMRPEDTNNIELFERKARTEAHLAQQAKEEFLANINHEFMTPLNIIIGMLSLAQEDESMDEQLQADLALAKDAADGLSIILNDLITLSSLAANRLSPDIIQFSLSSMMEHMQYRFASQSLNKGVTISTKINTLACNFLEGGYNFICQALEKIICNSIKVSEVCGQVDLKADLFQKENTVWLQLIVTDNGPGFDQKTLVSQELFHQEDSSLNRKHGGLGLGLNLATNLTKALGGKLILANRPEGGAIICLEVPVKEICLEDE